MKEDWTFKSYRRTYSRIILKIPSTYIIFYNICIFFQRWKMMYTWSRMDENWTIKTSGRTKSNLGYHSKITTYIFNTLLMRYLPSFHVGEGYVNYDWDQIKDRMLTSSVSYFRILKDLLELLWILLGTLQTGSIYPLSIWIHRCEDLTGWPWKIGTIRRYKESHCLRNSELGQSLFVCLFFLLFFLLGG